MLDWLNDIDPSKVHSLVPTEDKYNFLEADKSDIEIDSKRLRSLYDLPKKKTGIRPKRRGCKQDEVNDLEKKYYPLLEEVLNRIDSSTGELEQGEEEKHYLTCQLQTDKFLKYKLLCLLSHVDTIPQNTDRALVSRLVKQLDDLFERANDFMDNKMLWEKQLTPSFRQIQRNPREMTFSKEDWNKLKEVDSLVKKLCKDHNDRVLNEYKTPNNMFDI